MSGRLAGGSIALRTTGLILATGYIFGVASGPVVGVIGALALATAGRLLFRGRTESLLAAGSLAVIAGALGIGALRWGLLDLEGMQDVQAVLGPTLLVGPPEAAAAAWAGVVASILALGVWSTTGPLSTLGDRAWASGETAVVAVAVASVFWGEGAPAAGAATSALPWLAAALGAALAGVAGWGLVKLGSVARWVAVGVAGAVVTASAALLAGAL